MTTHIINRQIIDLKVRSDRNAFRLQQQVREAYHDDILPLLGELLDELSGPGEILRIDRLDLDLGTVQAERMGEQMKERLREALREQLRKARAQAAVHFSPGASPESYPRLSVGGSDLFPQLVSMLVSQRELLQEFFETGLLPWWAGDETEAPDLDAIIQELLEKEPVTTVQWLRRMAMRAPHALQRVEMQLGRATQQKIIAAAPGETVAIVRRMMQQLQVVLQDARRPAVQLASGERVVFLAVLTLRDDVFHSPAPAAEKIFVPQFIRILAAISDTTQEAVREQLYAGIMSAVISGKETVTAFPALTEELVRWEKEHPAVAIAISETEHPVLELLLGSKDEKTIGQLADIIEQGLKKYEERRAVLAKILEQKAGRGKKTSRIVKSKKRKIIPGTFSSVAEQHENEETLAGPGLIDPAEPASYTEKIPGKKAPGTSGAAPEADVQQPQKKTVAEELKDIPAQLKTKRVETPAELSAREIEKTEGLPVVETPAELAARETEKSAESLVTEISVSSAEEQPGSLASLVEAPEDHPMLQKKPSAGMTRFGGLVLIAPFLPAFFNELKLVTDGQFRGDAERHKAIHLLNFIASGKTKAPEYALLLHKLLCGMEITAPVPKTIKLSAAERKEALFLLDDIAEQWTALRGASGQAIRETFMRRNGIIEKKEHGWLLRVEKAPMDIMLETFPWSISIIKAPWMQQLLHVEW